jgi:hypothetical protein
MRTVGKAMRAPPPRTRMPGHAASSVDERAHTTQPSAAKSVEHDPDVHSGTGALAEGGGEAVACTIRMKDVTLHRD